MSLVSYFWIAPVVNFVSKLRQKTSLCLVNVVSFLKVSIVTQMSLFLPIIGDATWGSTVKSMYDALLNLSNPGFQIGISKSYDLAKVY